jgi:cell division septum initiation protein DivIVA
MSVELHTDDGAARPLSAFEAVVLGVERLDNRRPNVSGDLSTVLRAAPMFRRAVAGYDRFQVDTYVQWAEDELVAAEREREHLVARHLRTRAELEDARELLSHSSGGGEMLRMSRRIGSMLAAAADEAGSMRAEAEAARFTASAEAEGMIAHAQRVIADAGAETERMVGEAARVVEEMTAEAGRIVDEAERTARETRAEAAARLETVRVIEQRAAEHAGRIRRQAVGEASAARLQARDEAVRMLSSGREERRRADADAAATRARLDRDAATRSASLLAQVDSLQAQVEALEHRRSALRADVELLAEQVTGTTSGRLDVHLRALLERFGWRSRSLRAP